MTITITQHTGKGCTQEIITLTCTPDELTGIVNLVAKSILYGQEAIPIKLSALALELFSADDTYLKSVGRYHG